MKRILIYIGIAVVLAGVSFLFGKCSDSARGNVYIYDTTVVERYTKELESDTVVKWYQKIKYKIQDPEKIYVQSVDTVFIEKIQNYDLILQVKKHGDKLIIRAINQAGRTIKEMVYDNVGRDYDISSKKDGVVVKAKKFYWTGMWAFGAYMYPMKPGIKWNSGEFGAGLQTGISYLDKMELNLKTEYNFKEKDVKGGIELTYNLFR